MMHKKKRKKKNEKRRGTKKERKKENRKTSETECRQLLKIKSRAKHFFREAALRVPSSKRLKAIDYSVYPYIPCVS